MAGAAVLGVGNSITGQVSAGGWNSLDVGKVLGDTGMSLATAYIGGKITQGLSPYIDQTIGAVITNSVIKESLTRSTKCS